MNIEVLLYWWTGHEHISNHDKSMTKRFYHRLLNESALLWMLTLFLVGQQSTTPYRKSALGPQERSQIFWHFLIQYGLTENKLKKRKERVFMKSFLPRINKDNTLLQCCNRCNQNCIHEYSNTNRSNPFLATLVVVLSVMSGFCVCLTGGKVWTF